MNQIFSTVFPIDKLEAWKKQLESGLDSNGNMIMLGNRFDTGNNKFLLKVPDRRYIVSADFCREEGSIIYVIAYIGEDRILTYQQFDKRIVDDKRFLQQEFEADVRRLAEFYNTRVIVENFVDNSEEEVEKIRKRLERSFSKLAPLLLQANNKQ